VTLPYPSLQNLASKVAALAAKSGRTADVVLREAVIRAVIDFATRSLDVAPQ